MPSDEMRRAAIRQHLDAAKNYGEDTPVLMPLRREHLKALDTKPLLEFLHMLLADAETVRAFRGRIAFELRGFEQETRDPEDIPELRNYLRAVSKEFPYWFWFMERESPFLKLLLYCLCDADMRADMGREHVLRRYSDAELKRFMDTYGGAVNELKARVGLSEAEVAARLAQVKHYYKQQGIYL